MSPQDKRLLGQDTRDTKSQIALGMKETGQKMQETLYNVFNKTENNSSFMSNFAPHSTNALPTVPHGEDPQRQQLSHRDQSGLTQQLHASEQLLAFQNHKNNLSHQDFNTLGETQQNMLCQE